MAQKEVRRSSKKPQKHQNGLPKIIEFFIFSNVIVYVIRVRINAIRFIFFEADVRNFEIRIIACRKRNQNRWHFSYGFPQTEMSHINKTKENELSWKDKSSKNCEQHLTKKDCTVTAIVYIAVRHQAN